ncbi:MAG TPA: DEAD/DEAH box helicase, partial [Candidatus Fimiplasma intestinipullorum]|nr:DEAD/DEAH box helicase [Candidatus Fimiplasma intestinipullorum]
DKRSQETLKMLDDLHVDMKQMHDGILTLSLSQAFYLNEHLSDTKDFDESFHQFIERFYHPDAHPYSLPNGLQADLRTYQKTGYQWLKTLSDYQLGGILADDMGLGKTLQTITYLLDEVQHNHKPNLVVAPSSLIFNWQDEIKRFAPSLKACVISGTQTDRSRQLSQADQYDILITSYPLLRRDSQVYSEMIFNCCILDEAQYIKNANSLNARAAKQIQAKKRFALTGTPMENALSELWSIFDFILPGYFSNYHHFHQKYEIPIRRDEDQETQQLLANQIKPFILRRMKQEVLDELPEKTETKITVEMTPRQKNVYQALLLEAKQLLDQKINQDGFEKSKLLMLNLMTRLRQVCCHPKLYLESYDGESGKLNTLLELIKEAIQSHHKILVFSQFTSMLALIKEALELNEITYSYLDGQTPVANRTELVQQFNQGETPVFLISLKAGGTGLNLTGADMVIHVDPWWNPAVEEQATDRAYRIGQQNKVQVYKLITKDTLEDAIYELQKEKKALIESVIQPGENFLNKLSESELYALFSNDQSM